MSGYVIRKLQLQQINIAKETTLTAVSWIIVEVAYISLVVYFNAFVSGSDHEYNMKLGRALFFLVLVRNLCSCMFIFYYSIIVADLDQQD